MPACAASATPSASTRGWPRPGCADLPTEGAPVATEMTSAEFFDRLRVTTEFLEAVIANRGLLAQASPDQQRQLVQAAGQLYAPDANARRQLVRATVRRRKAERVQREDELLDRTGIRTLRRQSGVHHAQRVSAAAASSRAIPTAIRTSASRSSRNTATSARRSTRSCITSTTSSARRAPRSTSPSGPSWPISRAGWRCSPAVG